MKYIYTDVHICVYVSICNTCITFQIKVGPQNSQLQHSSDHIPYLPSLAYLVLTPHISQFLKHTKRIPASWFLSCASLGPRTLSPVMPAGPSPSTLRIST